MAERRWGSKVGGLLVGLPLTSAPVTLFIALELGTTFASQMATAILMGLISQAVFCLTYAWLSCRLNWVSCWLLGWTAFGGSTFAFKQFFVPLAPAFLAVIGVLMLALISWPKSNGQEVATRAPSWALVGRLGMATAMVLLLTNVATLLGPQLSGLLSPLPIFATVFAIFAHKFQSAKPARQILHGVIVSSFACAVFFLVVAEGIEQWGIFATFCLATLLALLTQGGILFLARKLRNQEEKSTPLGNFNR